MGVAELETAFPLLWPGKIVILTDRCAVMLLVLLRGP